MCNPIRRNRNAGTARRGHGRDNRLVIPGPTKAGKFFYEKLTAYRVIPIAVRGRTIRVITEKPKAGYFHSLTAGDAARVLYALPREDVAGIGFVVFRQPKKKEKVLTPAWGRFVYAYQFGREISPAVIIEAVERRFHFRFPKKQTVADRHEFNLLRRDGLAFREDKRHYTADMDEGKVRGVQLYRTLLHEIGHHVHFLKTVERPGREDEDPDAWLARHDAYFRIPAREKEAFANRYARRWKRELRARGVIPFTRIGEGGFFLAQSGKVRHTQI